MNNPHHPLPAGVGIHGRLAGISLTLHDVGDELEDDVLHGAVEADVLQRVGLVDDAVTLGTRVPLLQVLHQAALADWRRQGRSSVAEA